MHGCTLNTTKRIRMKSSPHKTYLFYREQLHTSVKSIESTVGVIIAIFNAKPENFRPELIFPCSSNIQLAHVLYVGIKNL